jgi:hypothetical protein
MFNELMAQGATAPLEPKVGMGATLLMWSDRKAMTVVEVKSKKTIRLTYDKAIRTDTNGMSDSQSYRYEQDERGIPLQATLRKDGRWRISGYKTGGVIVLGERDAYHDYSF